MPDEPELSFEEALTQLERIVESLERGEPELSAALSKYESGVKLLRHCYNVLERAQNSVALLTGVDEQGNPVTVPFDAAATSVREFGPIASAIQPVTIPNRSVTIRPNRSFPSPSPARGGLPEGVETEDEVSGPPF